MKYKVTYTMQREVSVIVEIADNKMNTEFERLGAINSDADFTDQTDPRWEIEQAAYESYSCGDGEVFDTGDDSIVDRSITKYED